MASGADAEVALLLTDLEGSTRMWEAHPVAMRQALARHDALVRGAIAAHGGRVFKAAGDAFYAVFDDPADAVAAALAAQRGLHAEAWPAPLALRARMALHAGPVEARDGDFFGSTVNRAARILAAGHGGQVLLSDVVAGRSGARLPAAVGVRDLGEHRLKDLATPERVHQLVAAGLPDDFPPLRSLLPRLDRRAPTLAVLPFTNASHAPGHEYFADGLADELATMLSRVAGLRVASRSSAFAFKGSDADLPTIASRLGVAALLEGSVRAAGTRVRVTATLIEVATDARLWSRSYDRQLDDLLAVQDDIARAVVDELRVTLLDATADASARRAAATDLAAATRGRSGDAQAWRLYLQGRYLIGRRTPEETAQGIERLHEALRRDPAFALAWVALAVAHGTQEQYQWGAPDTALRLAREAVDRALALEPQLPEAHAQRLWHQLVYDWDVAGAEASLREALALAPQDTALLRRAGLLADLRGRFDEAFDCLRRAADQDPLHAGTFANLGVIALAGGRLAEAEQALRTALDLAPQQSNTRAFLAQALLAQGRLPEALDEAAREPDPIYRPWALALVRHAAGDRAGADAALAELTGTHAGAAAFQIAEVHAARGDADAAFAWLDRAFAQRDGGLLGMGSEPVLRPLHADPRWDALLAKVGLRG